MNVWHFVVVAKEEEVTIYNTDGGVNDEHEVLKWYIFDTDVVVSEEWWFFALIPMIILLCYTLLPL